MRGCGGACSPNMWGCGDVFTPPQYLFVFESKKRVTRGGVGVLAPPPITNLLSTHHSFFIRFYLFFTRMCSVSEYVYGNTLLELHIFDSNLLKIVKETEE